ncbi:MAG: hypothetical protein A3K59_08675 [Euryarchaeota archaeon RBG_19FT_COMBO_69_17]|nr:MAG: hypothetical protein A3K59_08675 [Euryarchaeota archaeon RBG_19FT_COMBO_69_17]
MQRRRAEGEPEEVFAEMQGRLRAVGAELRLVDPMSISLLFEFEVTDRGPPTMFFLAVVPADGGGSNIALARKRKGVRSDFRAMVVGEDDPIETRVLDLLMRAP